MRWGIVRERHYRWARRRRWLDRYGVDPWLGRLVDPWLGLIIVPLLGAVLGHCIAVFLLGR